MFKSKKSSNQYNFTTQTNELLNFIKQNNKVFVPNRILLNKNLKDLLNYFHKNYLIFMKEKILLKTKEDNQKTSAKNPIISIDRNDIFLDNVDTCQRKNYQRSYLLNVELILFELYNNHRELLLKMLRLHKYSENDKDNLLDFISNIPKYRKKYVINWMNKNGIELMRSLYIFLLNGRLPDKINQLVGEDLAIYGEFTSLDIQEEIELSLPYIQKHSYSMKDTELSLIINSRQYKNISEDFIRRCFYLHFLLGRNKKINLKIWLSKLKKYLPNQREEKFLGPKEINSGCANGIEITLWRKEEISKIMIHEIIHYLDLEKFVDIDEIRGYFYKKFDIKRNVKINFFEGYTEIWTNILNICFIIFSKKNKNHKKSRKTLKKTDILSKKTITAKKVDVISRIIKMLNYELLFNLFQTAKVLDYFGYHNFSEFYNFDGIKEERKSDKYNQRTNVFSYFIGRSLIFYNLAKFINLCFKYNKQNVISNEIPAQEFINLIEDTIKNTDYVERIDKLLIFIRKNKNENDLKFRTLRFTLFETKF